MVKKKSSKSSNESSKQCCEWKCACQAKGSGGCIWFLGFIGALVFYIQAATGFWAGVLGVLKALVWPAILVYHLLGL